MGYIENNLNSECIRNESLYLIILRTLIAISFIATPLNPSIGGMTLYLWIPLVLLDYNFLFSFKKISVKILLGYFIWCVCCLIISRLDLVVKSSVLFLGVMYLCMVKKEILNKIFIMMNISILWCIAQFILYQISPSLSVIIGPNNIARTVWGGFATETYTNQYVVALFPRMSGLSREAGFFVSLLSIVFILRLRNKNINLRMSLLFFLGFLFSISKSSFAIVMFFIIKPFRRIINTIPSIYMLLFVVAAYYFIALYLNVSNPHFFLDNGSAAQRFSAAYFLSQLDFKEIILGCNISDVPCFNSDIPLLNFLMGYSWYPNMGIPGLLLEMGVFGVIGIVVLLFVLKLDSFDIIILALFTSTVTLFTVDSFIILTYYYIVSNHASAQDDSRVRYE